MAAFYPEKSKKSFFIKPAVWWICMSLNFSSRVVAGSAFCPNEEQEELLYLSCRERNMFAVPGAFKNGCSVSILSIEMTKKSFIVPATKVMRLL